jgi:hypothetical protein
MAGVPQLQEQIAAVPADGLIQALRSSATGR